MSGDMGDLVENYEHLPRMSEVVACVCPVCQGRRVVPTGFYKMHPCDATVVDLPEKCRSCGGKGYVIVKVSA